MRTNRAGPALASIHWSALCEWRGGGGRGEEPDLLPVVPARDHRVVDGGADSVVQGNFAQHDDTSSTSSVRANVQIHDRLVRVGRDGWVLSRYWCRRSNR